MSKKRLRSGFTTGACAAAATKAALLLLTRGISPVKVDIPFPDGGRHCFTVHNCGHDEHGAWASIIKDAGDDPDVTNGAEIQALVSLADGKVADLAHGVELAGIYIYGGEGVGHATKPGLAIGVGEPAINPVPRQMIVAAAREVSKEQRLQVVISVLNGAELAEKTLNYRLGIVGGLSVLGTTGIVRPISAEAWTATISASMSVAREAGLKEIVLATGRTSERGVQAILDLQEEAYAMMGDYLEFSLLEAARYGFQQIHLAGMWAKITKAALEVPQTHVRNGVLEMQDAVELLAGLGAAGELLAAIKEANTARQMHELLVAAGRADIIRAVCVKAGEYGREVSGCPVKVYLVDSKAQVLVQA